MLRKLLSTYKLEKMKADLEFMANLLYDEEAGVVEANDSQTLDELEKAITAIRRVIIEAKK